MRQNSALAVLACALASLALTPRTRAQAAAYGTVGVVDYGVKFTDRADLSVKSDTAGLTGGVFYNFPAESRGKLGLDARFSGAPGGNGGVFGAGAFRVSFVPHQSRLRPYGEVGGGVVHTTATSYVGVLGQTTAYKQSFTGGGLMLLVGLDIRVTPNVDLRLPEFGAIAGGRTGSGFLNGGVVYHFGS